MFGDGDYTCVVKEQFALHGNSEHRGKPKLFQSSISSVQTKILTIYTFSAYQTWNLGNCIDAFFYHNQ